MDPERWKQVESLLQAVLDRPPEERDEFLRQASAGDPALEREVRRADVTRAGRRFLDRPAMGNGRMASHPQSHEASDLAIGKTVSHYRVIENWAPAVWAWCTRLRTPSCTALWR